MKILLFLSALCLVWLTAECRSFPVNRPCPARKHFAPVCASNGVTYANSDLFQCAKDENPGLVIVKRGPCKGGVRGPIVIRP